MPCKKRERERQGCWVAQHFMHCKASPLLCIACSPRHLCFHCRLTRYKDLQPPPHPRVKPCGINLTAIPQPLSVSLSFLPDAPLLQIPLKKLIWVWNSLAKWIERWNTFRFIWAAPFFFFIQNGSLIWWKGGGVVVDVLPPPLLFKEFFAIT